MTTAPDRLRGRRWMALRGLVLSANPMCVRCLAKGIRGTEATEVDHKNGDRTDNTIANLQGLCTPCHVEKTAEDMGYVRRMGCDENGFPRDPAHPWNKDAA
jgi:5-methylcytosine-specific restriction protein A